MKFRLPVSVAVGLLLMTSGGVTAISAFGGIYAQKAVIAVCRQNGIAAARELGQQFRRVVRRVTVIAQAVHNAVVAVVAPSIQGWGIILIWVAGVAGAIAEIPPDSGLKLRFIQVRGAVRKVQAIDEAGGLLARRSINAIIFGAGQFDFGAVRGAEVVRDLLAQVGGVVAPGGSGLKQRSVVFLSPAPAHSGDK